MGQRNEIAERFGRLVSCGLQQASPQAMAQDPAAGNMQAERLYERWVREPEWALRAEGVPLLIGIAPEAWEAARKSDPCRTAEYEVWSGMARAVRGAKTPPVRNPEASEDEWRIAPLDLYRWASASGIPIPEPFEALMQFIQRVLPGYSPEASSPAVPPTSGSAASSIKEKVLGAALNVLAKCPEQCYDQYGMVSGEEIARVIAAQSLRWFDTGEPPMPGRDMAALIDKCLE